jgi:hypothetical protein
MKQRATRQAVIQVSGVAEYPSDRGVEKKWKERRKYDCSGIDDVSVHSLCGGASKRAPERNHAAEDAVLISRDSCA